MRFASERSQEQRTHGAHMRTYTRATHTHAAGTVLRVLLLVSRSPRPRARQRDTCAEQSRGPTSWRADHLVRPRQLRPTGATPTRREDEREAVRPTVGTAHWAPLVASRQDMPSLPPSGSEPQLTGGWGRWRRRASRSRSGRCLGRWSAPPAGPCPARGTCPSAGSLTSRTATACSVSRPSRHSSCQPRSASSIPNRPLYKGNWSRSVHSVYF